MPPQSALAGLPRFSVPSTLVQPPVLASLIPLTSGGLTSLAGAGVSFPPPSLGAGTSTSSITNLLPLAHHSLQSPSEGVYLGDGIPPVPEKLAAKIRRGEFVEMGELLPEFWSPRGDEGESGRESKGRRSRKVTDIFYVALVFRSLCSGASLGSTPLDPRTDGIFDHHSTGESGLYGPRMGSLRRGILPTGSPH